MAQLKIGLVGAGSMGANHARVIAESQRARLAVVVDADVERATALATDAGAGAIAATGIDAVLACDAVVVASSTESHPDVAAALLDARIPLLVEKPLAADIADVEAMIKQSDALGVPLMCGFVERFNPVVATVRSLIAAGDGPPQHIVGLRHSPHTPRATTSVVHDLLIHDIDLVMHISSDYDASVAAASAWRPTGAAVNEVADCTVRFADGRQATLSASRASQRKIRTLQVATASALYEIDLLRQDVSVYRHVSQSQVGGGAAGASAYRAVTVVDVPFVRHGGEPLALQFDHFVDIVCGAGGASGDGERATLLAPHRAASDVELWP